MLRVLWIRARGADIAWNVSVAELPEMIRPRNITIGHDVILGKAVRLNARGARISIGKRTVLAGHVRLDAIGGPVILGNNVLVNNYAVITAWSEVRVGNDTRIAPFCHITDRNHGIDAGQLIRAQEGETSPIMIGEDVWIASSCVILKGVRVGGGAVIGANSVVNNHVDPYTIVAGSPARVIGRREPAIHSDPVRVSGLASNGKMKQ